MSYLKVNCSGIMFHTSHAMPTGMVLMPKIQIKDNTQNKKFIYFRFLLKYS